MFKVENENSLEKIYQIGFNIREIEATHVPSSSFIPTITGICPRFKKWFSQI